jgi:hypothetical protein
MKVHTSHKAIITEIFNATSQIQLEFPTVYANLDETPLVSSNNNLTISDNALKDYAETLMLNIFLLEKKKE